MLREKKEAEKGRISFRFSAKDVLENVPDLETMDADALKTYHLELEEAVARLDAAEPKNENSEAYDQWAEEHEDLEDLLDEVLDLLEDME